jgi:uncharacterized protein (UPF0335 family)
MSTLYNGLSGEHLRQFVERIERLEEEKRNIAEDIKSVFQEAKSTGFDVPAIREILKLRKKEQTAGGISRGKPRIRTGNDW